MICQLQNAKSNFSKFSKVHALQKKKKKKKKQKKKNFKKLKKINEQKKKKKKKKKTGIFIYTFRRKLCLNSQFKNRFQEVFSIKVVDTKKCTTCT